MKHEILIEELMPEDAGIITESATDGKNTWLAGVMMQAGIKNRNGREYPITEIAKAVEGANKTIKEHNGIFGELDHPKTLTVNLDRVSHVITEMRMDGSNAVGKAKLLDTPMGSTAKAIINSGVRIGVSSRGAGAVSESGSVSDFNFVTIDLVATPSAPGAVPNAVYESMLDSVHGREALSLAEQLKDDPRAQHFFKREILKFLEEGLFAKK